ncbi:hypothetical protein KQI84_13645 [bacterium]|nr:hypothetical protein [bacterium]
MEQQAIPLELPASLEHRRAEFEGTLREAQSIIARFAAEHGWEDLIREPFADSAHIYDSKDAFDAEIRAIFDIPPDQPVHPTHTGALEERRLMAVAPEIYRKLYPAGDEPGAFAKLLAHEIAHRLHIRILDGDEDAMGPIWFFEAFAITAVDQFADTTPTLSPERMREIVQAEARGHYPEYRAVLKALLPRVPLTELVDRAARPGFTEWVLGQLPSR